MSAVVNAPAAQRFVVLDSCRGLCALAVVVFHLHILGSFTELPFFRSAGLFVEFFFTLSGFVLSHSYAQRTFDGARLRSFLISRTFRIFPLHLAMLLLYTVLELAKLLAAKAGTPLGAAFAGSNELAEWWPNALLLQAWLPETDAFSFNGPAWSISIEFYIYLVFGLLLFGLFRYRKLVFGLIVLICTVCVVLNAGWIGDGGFRGITCFFLGALAYEIYQRSRHWQIPDRWISALELAMLASLYFCLTLQYPHKSFFASGFFALCIVVFAREGGVVSRLLLRPACVNLGHWSFSIYLTHYVLISLLTQVVVQAQRHGFSWITAEQPVGSYQLYLDTGHPAGNWLLGLAMLALVLLVSSVSYRHVEQRGMAFGKKLIGRRAEQDIVATGLAKAAGQA